jgi:hypothetical protein
LDLHNFYTSPNNIREVKSKNVRWTDNIARMGSAYRLVRPEGKRPRVKIILEWTLGKRGVWTKCIWLRTEASAEPVNTAMKGGEFID